MSLLLNQHLTIDQILKYYECDYDTIFTIKNLYRYHVKIRFIIYYILKDYYGATHKGIAKLCNSDRACVIRGIRKAVRYKDEIDLVYKHLNG